MGTIGKQVALAAPRTFEALLASKRDRLMGVAERSLNIDMLARIVLQCLARTPALQKCTQTSVYRSVLQAAELGLIPGGASDEAHLVAYGNQCTLIVGYKGYEKLALRDPGVAGVIARNVFEGEEYEETGGGAPTIHHRVRYDIDRTEDKVICTYAIMRFNDGRPDFFSDPISRHEMGQIRRASRASNGPWSEWPLRMMLKSAIRRTCNAYVPPPTVERDYSALRQAAALDGAADGNAPLLRADWKAMDEDDTDEEPQPTATEGLAARLGVQRGNEERPDDGEAGTPAGLKRGPLAPRRGGGADADLLLRDPEPALPSALAD